MTADKQITSAEELYQWAVEDNCFLNISVLFRTEKDYRIGENFLKNRFENCTTITGAQKLHYVEPAQECELKLKTFSMCSDFQIMSFTERQKSKRSYLKRKRE